MFETEYQDVDGRKYWIRLPDGATPDEYKYGLRIGPPDISDLHLPHHIEVRLHNELYARRLFHFSDVRHKRQDLMGALMATLRVDTERLLEMYLMATKEEEE